MLEPLARERRRVSSALENSAEVAQATAERGAELEADIERLPAFLRELRPTMQRLGSFADEATPVFDDLGAQAPAINRFVRQLCRSRATCARSPRTCGPSRAPPPRC